MKARAWIVLAWSVLIIVGVGCGEDTPPPLSSEPGIAPLEALPGEHNGPRVTDITDRSAWVRFDADVPVVCNVLYGKTTEYGQVALMSMTTATTDHDVQIVGLEPETTYHFRVTVTDLSGRVVQSEDQTFTTLVPSKEGSRTVPAGRNVALLSAGTTVVGVSSNWGNGDNDSGFGANKAIDGNARTQWSSNGDGDDAWIEIELAQSYSIIGIGFWTRTMSNDTAQIFSFEVTADSGEKLGPFDLPDASGPYYFTVQVTARRLRFNVVSSNGGNTGAVEIEVYAL